MDNDDAFLFLFPCVIGDKRRVLLLVLLLINIIKYGYKYRLIYVCVYANESSQIMEWTFFFFF